MYFNIGSRVGVLYKIWLERVTNCLKKGRYREGDREIGGKEGR